MATVRVNAEVISVGGTFYEVQQALFDEEMGSLQVVLKGSDDISIYAGVTDLRRGQYLVDGVLRWGINPVVAIAEVSVAGAVPVSVDIDNSPAAGGTPPVEEAASGYDLEQETPRRGRRSE